MLFVFALLFALVFVLVFCAFLEDYLCVCHVGYLFNFYFFTYYYNCEFSSYFIQAGPMTICGTPPSCRWCRKGKCM